MGRSAAMFGILLGCVPVASALAGGPTFTDISAALPGLSVSSAAWGDYDNDGDLDVLLVGYDGTERGFVFRQDAGSFVDIDAGLGGAARGTCAWGDYDNDGDLDILVTGASPGPSTRLYRNDGNDTFTSVATGIPGLTWSSAAWGDCDNDGDLDVLVTGQRTGVGAITRVYRNDGESFLLSYDSDFGITLGWADWVDFDSDGDLDFISAGSIGTTTATYFYKNDGTGQFSVIEGTYGGNAAAIGDYDSDGDPDLALTGGSFFFGPGTRVLENNGHGAFNDTGAVLPALPEGSCDWGDFDNDGDLDLLLAGSLVGGVVLTRIYRNDGPGDFVDIGAGLPGIAPGAVKWGDFDDDGDLDILLTGASAVGRITRIYRNDGAPANTIPQAPSGLEVAWDGDVVTLSWDASSDVETVPAALSYNVRVGATPGGNEIVSGMSDASTGLRRVVARGNAGQRTARTLRVPPAPAYHWSVQAIDAALAGSPFSAEMSFPPNVRFAAAPQALTALTRGAVAWGDYDNDGDLDALVCGEHEGSSPLTVLYRNGGPSGLHDSGIVLQGLGRSAAAWGDVDSDGRLDLALAGIREGDLFTTVFRNTGAGGFEALAPGLPGVSSGSVAWADCNGDGTQDILLTGAGAAGPLARVYVNNGSGPNWFTQLPAVLPGVVEGTGRWGDFDNDGDPDILLTGDTGTEFITRVYENDGAGSFSDLGEQLVGVRRGSGTWVDYDNDGDLDILITGESTYMGLSAPTTLLYRNDAGVFAEVVSGLPAIRNSAAAWGDFDNDGDPDVVLAGDTGAVRICRVFLNGPDHTFVAGPSPLPGLQHAALAWGDADRDGDLDLLAVGTADAGNTSNLCRVIGAYPNQPPGPPTGLRSTRSGTHMTLIWNAAADDRTPSASLTYNVRMGTSTGTVNVISPLSDPTDGYRRVVRMGNAELRTSLAVDVPPDSYLFWSVQAVDGGFAGSPFATEARRLAIDVPGGSDLSAAPREDIQVLSGGGFPFFVDVADGLDEVVIFDLLGRRIRTLSLWGSGRVGRTRVDWDGRSDGGAAVGSGVYFARVWGATSGGVARIVVVR